MGIALTLESEKYLEDSKETDGSHICPFFYTNYRQKIGKLALTLSFRYLTGANIERANCALARKPKITIFHNTTDAVRLPADMFSYLL
jgi:hypothetical protein